MKKFLIFLMSLVAAASVFLVFSYGYRVFIDTDSFLEEEGAAVEPVLAEIAADYTDGYVIEKNLETADLPASYDYREVSRSTAVLDQGEYGTCWAFAALTALETALMPDVECLFSRDHLNYHNSYNLGLEGGSYSISVAYLTAWQGPVYESDDPYGDGESPDLEAVFHVQEVRFPGDKDYEAIKQTVYLYGGVETSLYMDITDGMEDSASYSVADASYYYSGSEEPNHDVVIIGWDDDYPAENFQTAPEGDGAFICQNSWGESFGDGGVFYVSYYDTNIGTYNSAYISAESADNYDYIYQSDLCGYTGQLGYNTQSGYFANVYEAGEDIVVRAAGFYATGDDTEYRIGVVADFEDTDDLSEVVYTDKGYLQYAGYYTVELEEGVEVEAGDSFAVVVMISTEGASYPIAVEYEDFDDLVSVDISDGEGYVSSDGSGQWERTEQEHGSNVCLKAYADAA